MPNAIDITKLLPADGFGFYVSEVAALAGEGIHKGDFVICRRKNCDRGQLFVGAIGEELYLRRLAEMEPGGRTARAVTGEQMRYVAKVVTLVRHFEGSP